MNDSLCVRRRQAVSHRGSDLRGSSPRQRFPGQSLIERFSPQQFGDHESRAVDVIEIVDGKDVRMGKGSHRPGFLLETLQRVRILGQPIGDDLDGYLASEPRIASAVNLAHTTGSKRSQDFERS